MVVSAGLWKSLGVLGLRPAPPPPPPLRRRNLLPPRASRRRRESRTGWGRGRAERENAKRAPDHAGRAAGGRGVPLVPLRSPGWVRVYRPRRAVPAHSEPGQWPHTAPVLLSELPWGVRGVGLHLCFPLPPPNNWSLGVASASAPPTPAAWRLGYPGLYPPPFDGSFISQHQTPTHFMRPGSEGWRPQAGRSRLLGAPGCSGPAPCPHGPLNQKVGPDLWAAGTPPPPSATQRGRGRGLASLCCTLPGLGNNGERTGAGMEGGGDREPSAGTESDPRERNCFPLGFSPAPKRRA